MYHDKQKAHLDPSLRGCIHTQTGTLYRTYAGLWNREDQIMHSALNLQGLAAGLQTSHSQEEGPVGEPRKSRRHRPHSELLKDGLRSTPHWVLGLHSCLAEPGNGCQAIFMTPSHCGRAGGACMRHAGYAHLVALCHNNVLRVHLFSHFGNGRCHDLGRCIACVHEEMCDKRDAFLVQRSLDPAWEAAQVILGWKTGMCCCSSVAGGS